MIYKIKTIAPSVLETQILDKNEAVKLDRKLHKSIREAKVAIKDIQHDIEVMEMMLANLMRMRDDLQRCTK